MNTICNYFIACSICLVFLLHGTIICEAQSLNDLGHKNKSWPIITRKGDQLMEGPSVFRFFGLCAPNIQQNESQIRIDRTNRFPDEYEIRDMLDLLRKEAYLIRGIQAPEIDKPPPTPVLIPDMYHLNPEGNFGIKYRSCGRNGHALPFSLLAERKIRSRSPKLTGRTSRITRPQDKKGVCEI